MCDTSSGMDFIDLPTANPNMRITNSGKYRPVHSPTILEPKYGGRMSGADNMAKVHRAQWEDYRSRFGPVEDMLFSRFNDDTAKQKAVDKAGLSMAGAFDRGVEQLNREMSRYGVHQTGDQAAATERTAGLKKAAAVAGARNAGRTAMDDQKLGIMAGGLSTVGQQKSGG